MLYCYGMDMNECPLIFSIFILYWCEQEINHFWYLISIFVFDIYKHSIVYHFIIYLLLFGPELFVHQICQVSMTFGEW